MVNASIKIDVPKEKFPQRGTLQILRDATITAPMVGDRTAAVRNDELQRREIFKNVGRQKLHKSSRIAVQVMRARGMKVRIARGADVNHRGHAELNHLFIKRVPKAIG